MIVPAAAPADVSPSPSPANPVLCIPGEVPWQQSPSNQAAEAEAPPLTLEEKDIIHEAAAEADQHPTAEQNPDDAPPKTSHTGRRRGREEQERRQILLAKGSSAQIPDDPPHHLALRPQR